MVKIDAISSLHVLELLSDEISMNIFNAIAKNVTNSENLMQLLNLTRKQYYDRSSRLLKIGLIRRKKCQFNLTSFGQLVRHSQLKIESAFKHSSALTMIDVVESDSGMSDEVQKSLIDKLIDYPEIKTIVLNGRMNRSINR